MFKQGFDKFACNGDKITCEVDGMTITARIEFDDSSGPPDQDDEGFWPSLDPKSPGYIGESPAMSYADQKAQADKVMAAWKNDEWFYCGIVLSVSKAGVTLDNHAASLWGIECNYPGSDNAYLLECANNFLSEAVETGKKKLAELCAA